MSSSSFNVTEYLREQVELHAFSIYNDFDDFLIHLDNAREMEDKGDDYYYDVHMRDANNSMKKIHATLDAWKNVI